MIKHRSMVTSCLLLLLSAGGSSLASAGQGGTADLILFDFWGFSIAPEPLEPGDRLEIVGVLKESTTQVPLNLNFNANEYTVHIHGLQLRRVTGTLPQVLRFRGGKFDIYRDPSKNAPFHAETGDVPALDPSQVPANFTDGQLLVSLKFRSYTALLWEPPGLGSIAFGATQLKVRSGSAFKALRRAGLLTDWHMGGGYTDEAVPAGYGMRYDPLIQWEGDVATLLARSPAPLQPATWGAIKSTFRE